MAKSVDVAWLKEMAAKLGDAVDVLEQHGNAKKELDAIKADVVRFQADRDKIIGGIKKQAEVEAKASADKIVADATALARRTIDKAHADADAHYSSVKETARNAWDQAEKALKERQKYLDALNEQCAELQSELDDLEKERDEAVGKMRELADRYKALA